MSSHRKHHNRENKHIIHPVKLMFDEYWNYCPPKNTENTSDKISSNKTVGDSNYSKSNTSTKDKIKEKSHISKKEPNAPVNIGPKILNSKVLSECKNHFDNSEIGEDIISIKTPVIIAGVKVDIATENKVKLNSSALNIKDINRRVLITECTLIPKAKKFFFSGTIRKSIKYSALTSRNSNSTSGRIKNITVYIPFSCVTEVDYIVPPEIDEKDSMSLITIPKAEVKEQTFREGYSEADKIYCELVNADFKELNIKDFKPYTVNHENINVFKTITQKMVMTLTIRLIQNQRIFIKNISKM